MKRTIEHITWRTWAPNGPADFPCLHCKAGKEATRLVTINNHYHLPLCTDCAELPVEVLVPHLKAKGV